MQLAAMRKVVEDANPHVFKVEWMWTVFWVLVTVVVLVLRGAVALRVKETV